MQIRHSCKRERTKEGGAIQKIKRERETLVMQKSGSNSNGQRSFRYKKQETGVLEHGPNKYRWRLL